MQLLDLSSKISEKRALLLAAALAAADSDGIGVIAGDADDSAAHAIEVFIHFPLPLFPLRPLLHTSQRAADESPPPQRLQQTKNTEFLF
jgi:hypothetical protein